MAKASLPSPTLLERCLWWEGSRSHGRPCGNPAEYPLFVKTRITQGVIFVCEDHRNEHDRRGKGLRLAGGSK
jgi:hypothetical protein